MVRRQQELSLPPNIDSQWRIGIVHSSYYKKETDLLVEGARETLLAAHIDPAGISVHPVTGSFEIPLIGRALAEAHAVDALIGLGIIVEGKTHHAHLIAEQAARGMMDVQIRYGIPFAFEVLFVRSLALAQERCTRPQNRGSEAASAVLHSLAELHSIHS